MYMAVAFFAGSFSPFTIGHKDIIERAAAMFDRVVVGIGQNSAKQNVESAEERAAQIRRACPGVEVVVYEGLTALAARRHNATVLLRSLRNSTDMVYETPIAEANRREFGIDTVFLLSRPELAHVSSSLVRELAVHGHDVAHLLG